MTNKEAIKRIQDIIAYTGLTIPTSLNDIEALEMAIKALEEERPQGEFSENYCPQCGAKMRGANNENVRKL